MHCQRKKDEKILNDDLGISYDDSGKEQIRTKCCNSF